jgi:hypothetical protein
MPSSAGPWDRINSNGPHSRCFKVLGLGAAVVAWSKGLKKKAVAAFIVWLAAVAYSLVAAVGFASLTRATVTAERTAESRKVQDARNEVERLRGEVKKIRDSQETTYILAKDRLQTVKNGDRFARTSGCTDATVTNSKEFCNAYWVARREAEDAKKAMESPTVQDLPAIAEKAMPHGAEVEADPQAAQFARMTGATPERVAIVFAIGFAVIAELVSSLGSFAMSRSIKPAERRSDEARAASRRRRRGRKAAKPALTIVR